MADRVLSFQSHNLDFVCVFEHTECVEVFLNVLQLGGSQQNKFDHVLSPKYNFAFWNCVYFLNKHVRLCWDRILLFYYYLSIFLELEALRVILSTTACFLRPWRKMSSTVRVKNLIRCQQTTTMCFIITFRD